MSFLQLPFRIKQSATMRVSKEYKPFWLTSDAYVFPNYALLDKNLNKQVALILYYAQVMDQKKLLKDFYRLCKDSFENKCEGKVLESAVKTWIKHSIIKLHRRREKIISNAVTTFQIEMISTLSSILLSIFCDLLQESSDKVSCLNALSKKSTYGADASQSARTFFSANGVLPSISKSKDFSACISEWDQWFLCLPFHEDKNLAMSVCNKNSIDWLRKFWLTFCYQPNPTNSIYYADATITTTSCNHTSQSYISKNMTIYNPTSPSYISKNMTVFNQISDIDQSYIPLKLTKSILKKHDINYNSRIDPSMFPHESFEYPSSTSSQVDSESSDSWSVTDFADEMSDKAYFNDICMSPGVTLNQGNPTVLWLQSPSVVIGEDYDSDESVIFGDVITEENCLERGGTNGSLYFIDTDEDDDFDAMFSETSAVACYPIDTYEDKSQAYDNPCFEEEFRSHRVSKYIKTVNEAWSEVMLGIENKPQRVIKVSFAPEPNLVTIRCFEKTEENSFDSSAILDRMRFQRRINEFNHMLAPFLTSEHRKEIERRNCFYQD